MLTIRQTDTGQALYSTLQSIILKRTSSYFHRWLDVVSSIKKQEEEESAANSLSQAKHIMKNSIRGQRTMVEQEALAKVLSTIPCLPKMSTSDMDLLTNSIDCIDCSGRTLIFLQGDFGACFYIIATGNIELYLEPSKDKEMSNCRNFGVYRGKSNFDLEKCSALGRHIVTLTAGQGFGEYAILSSTHKFRGATAVAADEDSTLLFIVNAETYNATLRKHHFRQQQMSSAMALLKELPIFNFQSTAKIAQFAYNLTCQTYSPRTVIARANTKINTLFLISSGSIKVVASVSMPRVDDSGSVVARQPDLCALEFGRGQIIGLWEILADKSTYEMTYITSASCELLEISHLYFQEVMTASKNIPTRTGEVPIVRTPALSNNEEKKGAPVFTTGMHRSVRPARRPPSPQHSLPTPTDSFFSQIQKAADDREHLHCGRLNRVKQTLRGSETRANNGAQGVNDLRSLLPLFSETLSTSPPVSAVGSNDSDIRKEAEQSRRRLSAKNVIPNSCSSTSGSTDLQIFTSRRPPIVQQYRNAVYHHTEASTTSVVCICRDEQTKEINLTNNFVKSELLSAPIYPPHHQPSTSQNSNSRINISPNKKHRTHLKIS